LKRAHDTMADLHRDWTRVEARAEDAEARVSELGEKLSEAGRRFAWASDANGRFEVRNWEEQKRAEAAEARLKDVDGDRWKLLLRAEDADAEVHDLQVRAKKAEADLSYYKTASENFEDSYWEANKRAEAAEKRAEQAEIDRSELLKYYERYQEAAKRAEAAEARVRELEKTHAPDTFTAPDGRVFRVGQ